jgi:hypothetical protein
MPEVDTVPGSGSLEDLCNSCGGFEDGFRGPLVKLERFTDTKGQKGNKATVEPLPFSQPYVKKKLFCVNLASPTTPPSGYKVVIASADVYLNNAEAKIAVYREP